MSKDKISSQEMVDLVASKLSVSKRVAEEFLKSLFAEIEEALLKGEPVKVKNLGTFKMQWNEPRKSVNVQTGEVFVIEGYNKVTFTPDSELKDAVNEPYSHLEPVELDGEMPDFEIEKPVTGVGDTLKNLSEQASEIKDILSEINALSTKKTAKQEVKEEPKEVEAKISTPIEIPDYDLILLDEDAEEQQTAEEESPVEMAKVTEPEVVVPVPDDKPAEIIVESLAQKEDEANEVIEPVFDEPVIAQPVVEQAPVITDTKKENEMENTEDIPEKSSSPFILGKKKKRKGLRFLIGLIVVLAIAGGAVYAVYFSSSCFRCWVEYDLFSEANRQKISEYTNTFKGWFSSDKKPAASNTPENDSVAKITLPADVANAGDTVEAAGDGEPKDSLQMLFDSQREYHEFLGEEEIGEGTRLTTIAQRYYGKKDFWVYIYEANRDNIVHPDRITPGTIVKIPKVDPRLIDKKNPRCIAKAKELHDLYVGKK